MRRTSKPSARNQDCKHDRADSRRQAVASSSDAHLVLLICQAKVPGTKGSHLVPATTAQILENLFGPLFCLLYSDAPSMSCTVLPLPKTLQVLLHNIENIYLSQAV